MKLNIQIHLYNFPPDEIWWGAKCAQKTIANQYMSGCGFVREDNAECFSWWTRTGNVSVKWTGSL